MSFLSRLLGTAPDPRESVRPLWHRVIELARDSAYYAECGVADSIAGRFDMITAVLSAVMVRIEASEHARRKRACWPNCSSRTWTGNCANSASMTWSWASASAS